MNEAGFSITFKLYNSDADQMVTFRGEHPADWPDVMESAKTFIQTQHAKGWSLSRRTAQENSHATETEPQTVPQAQAAPQLMQPQAVIQGDTGSFTANVLTIEFSAKGEKVSRLKGEQFAKYGVRCWPEAAAALGFDFTKYEPGDYSINPVAVRYVIKDGKPSKILGREAA